MDNIYNKLKTFGKVKLNEPMSKHTTFKIGGQVRYFVIVEENAKLIELLNYLSGKGMEYCIFGGGSNTLFQDEEYDGVVVKIKSGKVKVENNVIEAESGVILSTVMSLAMQNGLSGMEWSAGIPGTIGGAVRGNAGAFGQAVADVLKKVEVWKDGEVLEMTKEECEFIYRGSIFKNNKSLVILRVWFEFKKGDKTEVLKKVQEILKGRQGKYPTLPSAGCFFTNFNIKNWPGDKSELPPLFVERGKVPAGWMIENVGCKGLKKGGAQVGESHCNFVVNTGSATQKNILDLVEEVREKVYNKYGVQLDFEVEIF